MNLESERKLKFDRRLTGRRDWVTDEELEAELEALPDSAANVLPPDEDPPSAALRRIPSASTPSGGEPGPSSSSV